LPVAHQTEISVNAHFSDSGLTAQFIEVKRKIPGNNIVTIGGYDALAPQNQSMESNR
jgi:hypothetical protein